MPECELFLFGDDYGTAEFAYELNVRHFSSIQTNEFGTPLMSSIFSLAQEHASNNILVYANSDIIFLNNLTHAIQSIGTTAFLICGRRWDLDLREEIDFSSDGWDSKLLQKVHQEGKLHGPSGVDYFIFPQHSINMLPFAVGRAGWDGWLLYERRRRKIPIIDATKAIPVVHQNHDYSHSKYGGKTRVIGPEWERNIELAGGFSNFLTLREADWQLDRNGLRSPDFPGRFMSILSRHYPYRFLLSVKRKLQERFGS